MSVIEINFNNQKWRLSLRDVADQSVMREIFKIREYRSAEEKIAGAVAPIMDIGAHAGFFTIYCRAINPKVKIFAVEPEKENLKLLERHLKENKIKNVTVVEGALAGQTGKRTLIKSSDSFAHKLREEKSRFPAAEENTEEVMAYGISDLFKKYEIKELSLLKMDIEGGEYEALKSWDEKTFKKIKAIIMEYHDGEEGSRLEIEEILREHGFGVQIFPSKFDKNLGFIFANNKRQK